MLAYSATLHIANIRYTYVTETVSYLWTHNYRCMSMHAIRAISYTF